VIALVVILLTVIDINVFAILVDIFIGVFLLIGLKASLGVLLVLLFGSEASLGLTHLVEAVSVVVILIIMVFEDFLFLGAKVLVLKLGNDFLLLLAALGILEVVHI
jgi:hypothetical protein